MADNTVTLVGNITRDPELRYTSGGAANVSFGLAVNRRWQNRQTQEWEERVSFFNIVCWREMAENVAESLAKGSRVVVTGRLEQRSWETENGDKRSVVEVNADEIGPSLRWATAQVTRNDRRGGGDFARRRRRRRAAAAGPHPRRGGGGGPERRHRWRHRRVRRHGRRALLDGSRSRRMARQRMTRRKSEREDRKPKKKVSILDQESVGWVDYKDVNLLRRFMSERAKIRARARHGERREAAA